MALELSGSSQYLERSETTDSFPITLTAFFNGNTASGLDGILTQNDVGVDEEQNYIATNGDDFRVAVITGSNAVSAATVTDGAPAGVWHHGAGLCSSATSRNAYIDGSLSTTVTTSRPLMSMATYGIGYRVVTISRGDYFDGKIADAARYDAVLTARERAARDAGISALLINPAALRSCVPLIADAVDWCSRIAFSNGGSPTYARHPRVYM